MNNSKITTLSTLYENFQNYNTNIIWTIQKLLKLSILTQVNKPHLNTLYLITARSCDLTHWTHSIRERECTLLSKHHNMLSNSTKLKTSLEVILNSLKSANVKKRILKPIIGPLKLRWMNKKPPIVCQTPTLQSIVQLERANKNDNYQLLQIKQQESGYHRYDAYKKFLSNKYRTHCFVW